MKWICFFSLVLITDSLLANPNPGQLPRISPHQPFVFAVLGDNRGDDTGQQPAAFKEVLQALRGKSPAFVLDSGDMIYGHSSDEQRVREQWGIYRREIESLQVPFFHVPGNHDIWDDASAWLYRELWGPTHFAFDYGNSRFIGLDSETGNGRLGEAQLQWLEEQFANLTQRNVFIFLHRPLFPVDGGVGSSLDQYPAERDRIHSLFARNRQVVRGVFAGHEHLYAFQQRDGVPYYTSGGAGAPLYMAPELGGFHHFLLVRVDGAKVEVELNKVAAPQEELQKSTRIAPGQLLESWRDGLFWYAWDHTASVELARGRASKGRQGLRLNFDLEQYGWPVLVLPFASPGNLIHYESVQVDVYAPRALNGALLTPAVQGITKMEAPAVVLKTGWNNVVVDLNGQWLPPQGRAELSGLEWSLSAKDRHAKDYLVFDNLRAIGRNPDGTATTRSLEDFERPLLWRTFDETVRAEIVSTNRTDQTSGLLLHFDFAKCGRPVVFARLNPRWDLNKIDSLLLEIHTESSLPQDLAIAMAFRKNDVEYKTMPTPLSSDRQPIKFALNEQWLPSNIKTGVDQIEFTLTSTNVAGTAEIVFHRLSAANGS